MNSLSNVFLPRTTVFIGAIVFLASAFFIGRWVVEEERIYIGLFFAAFAALIYMAFAGERYWYILPFALAANLPAISLGARSVNIGEAAALLCTAIFMARIALKRDDLVLYRPTHVPALLMMGIVGFVYYLNPAGLSFLGSEQMGGRFYVQVFLGFATFLIMASRRLREEDLKWILVLLALGPVVRVIHSLLQVFVLGGASRNPLEEDGYTWHQILANPTIVFSFLLFAWKRPSEVFSIKGVPWMAFYGFCVLVALFSGKRMGIALIALAPFLSCILYRQYRYILVSAILAGAGSLVLIFGHGQMFTLPFTMQRSVSFLPAEWDSSLDTMRGGTDDFRAGLRRLAIEQIRKSPLLGEGYAINTTALLRTTLPGEENREGVEEVVAGHALSGNWHNTWLGYSADFGIPFAILHACLLLTGLWVSFYLARFFPRGAIPQILCAYILFHVCRTIVTSHTSGHSPTDIFRNWWLYGLLFAIFGARQYLLRQLKKNDAQNGLVPVPHLPIPEPVKLKS